MFKALIYSKKVERHNFEIFLLGFFYATISIFVSSWIFNEYSSIAMIFLCVLPIIYVLQGILKSEETIENISNDEEWILRMHLKKLFFMFFLFLGFTFAFSIWVFLLDDSKIDMLFGIQKETFISVTQRATGASIFSGDFFSILSNNLKVMSLSLIFAIFYGAGAIFILAWNASVMGFAIGTICKVENISNIPLVFLKYFIHGLPEMLAYLSAAMAGGIFFIAFAKGDLMNLNKLKKILYGVFTLVLVSILLLLISAFLEIYVSPLI